MATFSDLPPGVFKLTPKAGATPAAFPFGLGVRGVHEVCETDYGDMTAAHGFVLAALDQLDGPILHVQQSGLRLEHGALLLAGAGQAQRCSRPVLSVQVDKACDALWGVEEAVRSAAVKLVIAEVDACDFTASRRLVLAASRYGTPVVLLMPYTRQGASAATARWRVTPRLSSNNPFDRHGLGFACWRVVLERSRQIPQFSGRAFDLEWNDETLSLSMVPGLAAYQAEARQSQTGRSGPVRPPVFSGGYRRRIG